MEQLQKRLMSLMTPSLYPTCKLLCKAVLDLGGFEQEGIFRKAEVKDAETIRDLIHKGDYSVLRVDPSNHRRSSTGSTMSSVSSASVSSISSGGRNKPQLKDANVAADI